MSDVITPIIAAPEPVRSKWIRKCPHCRQLQHLDIVPALGYECWHCGKATTYRPSGLFTLPRFRPFYNRFWLRPWHRAALLLMIPIFALTYLGSEPLRAMTKTILGAPYYGPPDPNIMCDCDCGGVQDDN